MRAYSKMTKQSFTRNPERLSILSMYVCVCHSKKRNPQVQRNILLLADNWTTNCRKLLIANLLESVHQLRELVKNEGSAAQENNEEEPFFTW